MSLVVVSLGVVHSVAYLEDLEICTLEFAEDGGHCEAIFSLVVACLGWNQVGSVFLTGDGKSAHLPHPV